MSIEKEIFNILKEVLDEVQNISGREIIEIDEDTVPIGGIPGFDSMNGLELLVMLPDNITWSGKNLCISDDGMRALSIKEIIERLQPNDSKTDKGAK